MSNNWKQIGIDTYEEAAVVYGRDGSDSAFESVWGEYHEAGESQEDAGCDFGLGWIEAAREDFVSDAMGGVATNPNQNNYAWIWEGIEDFGDYTDKQIHEEVSVKAMSIFDQLVWDFGDKTGKAFPMDYDKFTEESDFEDALASALKARDTARDKVALESVMSTREIAEEFGIKEDTVRDAIEHNWLNARKSGATWLILRKHAEKRWGRNRTPA